MENKDQVALPPCGNNGVLSLLTGNIPDNDNELRGCDDGDNCQDDCNCNYGD